MEDQLEIEGKIYISSKRAAEEYGYTKDYIGQMARSGVIEAKLVGRIWYVLEEDLLGRVKHKKQDALESVYEEAPSEQAMVAEVSEESELDRNLFDALNDIKHAESASYEEIVPFAQTREPTLYEVARKRKQEALLADMDIRYADAKSYEIDDEAPIFFETRKHEVGDEPEEETIQEFSAVPIRKMERVHRSISNEQSKYVATKSVLNTLEYDLSDDERSYDYQEEEKPLRLRKPSFFRFGLAFTMLVLAVLGTLALSFLEKRSLVENTSTGQQASVSTEFTFTR